MSDDSSHPAAVRGGGYIQDTFDAKDHYYQAQASTQPQAHVNLREDPANFKTDIYDQGATSSCTANAAAAAFWYEEKAGRRQETWGSAGPSRLFIYWLARGGYKTDDHSISDVGDDGSMSREAMKGIATDGVCAENDCPFPNFAKIESDVEGLTPKLTGEKYNAEVAKRIAEIVNAKPQDTAFNDAGPHKITSYYRLDPDRPDDDDGKLTVDQKNKIGSSLLENLKKCLTEGFPVAFGFWYYFRDADMFDESQKPYTLNDVWNVPNSKIPRHTFPWDLPAEVKAQLYDLRADRKGYTYPGHSVLAVGYDDSRQAVRVQNSWGAEWSGDGTFWMPYTWITDFAASNDFWTIRTSHTAPAGPPKRWRAVHDEIMASA